MKSHVQNRISTATIYLGSAISVAGVQAVGPGLPNLQNHFGLSDSHTLWTMSFYLFPGIIAAVPLGRLADSIGRMKLYALCLLVFGIASSAIPFAGTSWVIFLMIRVIQGSAFAGILPLSIILVAEHGKGLSIMKRQGLRSASQQAADTLHPLIGGLLVATAWFAPYLIGSLTIPIALTVFFLNFDDDYKRPKTDTPRESVHILKSFSLMALVFGGFLRFFVKFVPLTSLGILLVNVHGHSAAFAGVALALSSFVGLFGALSVGSFSKRFSPFEISVSTLLFLAGSLVLLSLNGNALIVIFSVTVFGFSDGLFGTIQNSYVSIAVPNHMRGTFGGVVAMSRNTGKFLAPIAMGAMLAWASLSTAFAISGVFAGLSVLLLLPLRHFNAQLKESTS